MKVSINTTTALMIESSSHSSDETLIANAVALGIAAADVEIREVTAQEHDALIVARDAATVLPPEIVTMRQARLALLQSGLLTQVNDAVANMPGTEGEAARIEWEFASTVERNQPLVQALVGTLSLTEAQLDGLFELAATL